MALIHHHSKPSLGTSAVVIGGGHNGLTAACYLARAGLKVTVFEAAPRIGGMTSTYAAIEGCHDHLLSQASIDAVYWRASPVERELNLSSYGLRFVEHDPAWAWIGDGGESLVLQRDVGKTIADIAKFSRPDAERYREFVVEARKILDIQDAYGAGASTNLGLSTIRAIAAGLRDRSTRSLLGTVLTRSGADVIEGLFESPQLRGAFAAMGNILGSITVDGSGIAALATAPLHKYGVGRAIGGMQAIPDALGRCLTAHGGQVRCNTEVAQISVADGRVRGVVLADGEVVAADYIVSSAAPQITGALLDQAKVPAASVLRHAPANALNIGCFKVDIALSGQLSLPLHARNDGVDMRKPTIMSGSFEQALAAEQAAVAGRVPERPPWWATILSATDPTQAPPGQDVLYLYAPAPVVPEQGWEKLREQNADRLVSAAAEAISGIGEYEIGRFIETPADLAERLHAPNGCIYHVDQTVTRLGPLRPGLGWGAGDRAVKGLFLGGAGTHPSGGVSGLPGRIAARAVLGQSR
jgi:phytoene dehydrogenase-like protein